MGVTELQNATPVKGPRGLGRACRACGKTRDQSRRRGLATAIGEETVADAISDRFVYGAHRIKLRDESRLEGFALDGNTSSAESVFDAESTGTTVDHA
jgi:hypothetical protein